MIEYSKELGSIRELFRSNLMRKEICGEVALHEWRVPNPNDARWGRAWESIATKIIQWEELADLMKRYADSQPTLGVRCKPIARALAQSGLIVHPLSHVNQYVIRYLLDDVPAYYVIGRDETELTPTDVMCILLQSELGRNEILFKRFEELTDDIDRRVNREFDAACFVDEKATKIIPAQWVYVVHRPDTPTTKHPGKIFYRDKIIARAESLKTIRDNPYVDDIEVGTDMIRHARGGYLAICLPRPDGTNELIVHESLLSEPRFSRNKMNSQIIQVEGNLIGYLHAVRLGWEIRNAIKNTEKQYLIVLLSKVPCIGVPFVEQLHQITQEITEERLILAFAGIENMESSDGLNRLRELFHIQES